MYGAQTGIISAKEILLITFENDVEMYGAQTEYYSASRTIKFENDVEMYGAQTEIIDWADKDEFENDVEMYGAQTKKI